MTKFTASEVREKAAAFCDPCIMGVHTTGQMLAAYADRLEADEKAAPVYQVAGLQTGSDWSDCDEETFHAASKWPGSRRRRILYTHPAPADAESLAEALRKTADRIYANTSPDDVERLEIADMIVRHLRLPKYEYPCAYEDEAQPPAASVPDVFVLVSREPTQAMIDAVCKIKLARLETLRTGHEGGAGIVAAVLEEWEAMLAAEAQAQSGELVTVPHEPTNTMMDAASRAASASGVTVPRNLICAMYQTMLAAQKNHNG